MEENLTFVGRTEGEIRELYKTNKTESEIAKLLGISRQSMYDYRQRHKIPYDKRKARIKIYNDLYYERNTKICSAYLGGKSIDDICSEFVMQKPAILYILNKCKVKKKAISAAAKRNADMLKMRENGDRVKDIAAQYNINPQYVSTVLYKLRHANK